MSAKAIISVILLVSCSLLVNQAFADKINFEQCASNTSHHCMIQIPGLNAGTGPNLNEFVTINLPQNGAPVIQGILSHDNYTALENNVAVMRVQFGTTSAPPTLNYCPQAKIILENQGVPSYLNKFYNDSETPILNLTHFIYPDYCDIETGPNPVDHTYKITSVPEFNPALIAGLFACMMIGVISIQKMKK